MKLQNKSLGYILLFCITCLNIIFISGIDVFAAETSNAKIHFISLPENTDAILLECDGKFGMIDSGEDTDYPTGEPYDSRAGIYRESGFEEQVINYLYSMGVNKLEFYIATHPHSDHIGSADEIIREFKPDRVYALPYATTVEEESSTWISDPTHLWENVYVYNNMIDAAKDPSVNATLIQGFFEDENRVEKQVSTQNGTIQWKNEIADPIMRPDKDHLQLILTSENDQALTYNAEIAIDQYGVWSYTFKDVRKFLDNGAKAKYTMTAEGLSEFGYAFETSEDFSNVSLTYTGEKPVLTNSPDTLNGYIQWEDQNNALGQRPSELLVQLVKKTIVLPNEPEINAYNTDEEETGIDWQPIDGSSALITRDEKTGLWYYEINLPEQSETTAVTEYGVLVTSGDGSLPSGYTSSQKPADDTQTDYTSRNISFRSTMPQTYSENYMPVLTNASSSEVQVSNLPTNADPSTFNFMDKPNPNGIGQRSEVNDGLYTQDSLPSQSKHLQMSGSIPDESYTSSPVFTLGDGMEIEIVNYEPKTLPQDDANNFSIGVKVTANGKTAFISGDINNYNGDETFLASKLGRIDLLKLGHHGYPGSNSLNYLNALSPSKTILTGYFYNTQADTINNILSKNISFYATTWYKGAIIAQLNQNGISTNVDSKNQKNLVYSKGLDRYVYFKDGHLCKEDANTWIHLEGEEFFLLGNGYTAIGWLQYKGKWYYLRETSLWKNEWDENIIPTQKRGSMISSDWLLYKGNNHYFNLDGSMATGWVHMSATNSWYYFNSSGIMQTGWIGDSYCGEDGKWIPGYIEPSWKRDAGGWWYQNNDGSYPKSAWQFIDGNWYYFDSRGYMCSDWTMVNGSWYYLNPDGSMATGWKNMNGNWYYMNANGIMMTDWIKINGTWYYCSASGAMVTGWLNLGGTWYYLSDGGSMQTGWLYLGGTWYYFSENGSMKTGWLNLNGDWYYLNGSGSMQTGWLHLGSSWYYLNGSGSMQTGWLHLNGTWYYLNSNGSMQTGWLHLRGTWYYFNGSGFMQTGWLHLNDTWYYLNGSGSMQSGWLHLSGTWYYLNSDGSMQTGWLHLDEIWYYLNSSGAMLTGWIEVDNNWYYCYPNGAMAANTAIGSYNIGPNGAWI